MPRCNTEAMNLHLAEIATQIAPGAHAVLLVDQAGWHLSGNVGAFAALALFGKKFAVAIGIGVVALLSRVKSLFRRKNQTS
jgi:chromate transport protein ChrA